MSSRLEQRDRLYTDLAKALEALDSLADERAALAADMAARRKALARRVRELRDLLSGRTGVQEELPISGGAK